MHSTVFECYHWSSEDRVTINAEGGNSQAEKKTCESHFGFIYSQGDDSKAPECGGCSCCQPRIQGTFNI